VASLASIEKELLMLKKDNESLKSRVSALEKAAGRKSSSDVVVAAQVPLKSDAKEESSNAWVFIIIGAILTFTVIGAIIGIPLIIYGIWKSFSKEKAEPKENKEKASPPAGKKQDQAIEETAGVWFSRIGVLALVIGMGFFIKYAIDNSWINHHARLLLGLALGLGMIALGQYASKKEKISAWAKTLTGGGIALSYFMIYSAYHFEDYRNAIGMTQELDIFLLISVVIIAVVLSIKDNSQVIAAESFFLAYITSMLSNSFQFITLAYGLILTIGLVVVVSKKRWIILGLGGIACSYLLYIFWNLSNSKEVFLSMFILVLYYVSFTIQSFLVRGNAKDDWSAIVMTVFNTLAFYGLMYPLIAGEFPDLKGVFTLALSIVLFIQYYLNKESGRIADTSMYLGMLFLALFIPVQLDDNYVSVAWTLIAFFIMLIAKRTGISSLRNSSYAISVLVAIKLMWYDAFGGLNDTLTIRLWSFSLAVLCFYLLSNLLYDKKTWDWKVYHWAATLLLVKFLFMEIVNHANLSVSLSAIAIIFAYLHLKGFENCLEQSIFVSAIQLLFLLFAVSWDKGMIGIVPIRLIAYAAGIISFYIIMAIIDRARQGKENISSIFSYAASFLAFFLALIELEGYYISVGWSVLAFALMIAGFSQGKKHMRYQGIILLSITILKVFLYDTRSLQVIYRTLSYIVLGIILLAVSFIYARFKDRLKVILS
jgi:uncharacterized membrane protein